MSAKERAEAFRSALARQRHRKQYLAESEEKIGPIEAVLRTFAQPTKEPLLIFGNNQLSARYYYLLEDLA